MPRNAPLFGLSLLHAQPESGDNRHTNRYLTVGGWWVFRQSGWWPAVLFLTEPVRVLCMMMHKSWTEAAISTCSRIFPEITITVLGAAEKSVYSVAVHNISFGRLGRRTTLVIITTLEIITCATDRLFGGTEYRSERPHLHAAECCSDTSRCILLNFTQFSDDQSREGAGKRAC